MASTFKSFLNSDITTTRTMLHESIPVTGSILARTYGAAKTTETNIKSYGHGMFQSVYDYPYLSSSANHLMDITLGVHPDWAKHGAGSPTTITVDKTVKNNIYTQMQQILVGYDQFGALRKFDRDGNFSDTTADIYNSCAFISFSRLLVKDEIKKGSFEMKMGAGNNLATEDYLTAEIFGQGVAEGSIVAGQGVFRIRDVNAQDNFKINSPVGEYGILYASEDVEGPDTGGGPTVDNVFHDNAAVFDASLGGSASLVRCGLIYYQAGIVVLNMDIFAGFDNGASNNATTWNGAILLDSGNAGAPAANAYSKWYWHSNAAVTLDTVITGHSIDRFAVGLRHRIFNISFNNTTELNSTIYFCRANHNEFNYSSNSSYLNGSKIVVKENTTDQPVSYLTSVGLYSADNELLAVAKLSEPLKKDPTNELTLRVRLDY